MLPETEANLSQFRTSCIQPGSHVFVADRPDRPTAAARLSLMTKRQVASVRMARILLKTKPINMEV